MARFYEEVRVWMAKLDAEDRQSRGEPIPEDIQRLLGALIAESTESGEVLDIYEAAGMPKPSLMDLGSDFVTKAQHAENPHLAIEALRDLVAKSPSRRRAPTRFDSRRSQTGSPSSCASTPTSN